MAKESNTWTVTVGDDTIKVSDEGLFVNGNLQDISYGITTCARYYGKLPNGKEIKAVMGAEGLLGTKIHCCIFVDCECVLKD